VTYDFGRNGVLSPHHAQTSQIPTQRAKVNVVLGSE